MRILILSANTGEGHNSAARALRESFELRGCECIIQNALTFMAPVAEDVVCKGHIFCYRNIPQIYGMGYRVSETLSHYQKFQSALNRKIRHARSGHYPRRRLDLEDYILRGGFDAIICVHVFAAQMVSELRGYGLCDLPMYFLATDYTCSPGVNQLDMDAWIIPHPDLMDEFADQGIPRERIAPLGLPVRSDFYTHPGRIDARRELQLPEDKQIVLFSCGSMGGGSMGKTVLALTEIMPEDALLIAVCGNNHLLETNLKALIHSPRLMVLGYVNRMGTYMDAADLFITKPGGLSVTEAVTKRVPLMLIDVAPGCETRNMRFMQKIGCASTAGSALSLASEVKHLLEHPDRLTDHADACVRNFSGNSAERICDLVISGLRGRKDS